VSCLVDALSQTIRSAQDGTATKVLNNYRNSNDDDSKAVSLSACDAKGPLFINTVKLLHNEQTGNFYAFGRVISGTVRRGEQVKVLGEGYTLEEEEDMIVRSIHRLWINQTRYKIEVDMITAGNWVMIEGID
jgi:U5 small nuclear ribonucleoprotein component